MPEPSPPADATDSNGSPFVAAAASLARGLRRTVQILTSIAALAGGTLWLVLVWPPSVRPGALLGTALLFLFLQAPAAVLGLFYVGLRDLAVLPDRVSAGVSETTEASVDSYRAATDAADARWEGVRRLFGKLWTLRTLLTEHRATLVRYGLVLRIFTPGFLLLVVGAAGLTLLLVPSALFALLVVVLF